MYFSILQSIKVLFNIFIHFNISFLVCLSVYYVIFVHSILVFILDYKCMDFYYLISFNSYDTNVHKV